MTIENIVAAIEARITKGYEYRAKAQGKELYSTSWLVFDQLAEQEFREASGMVIGYIMFAPKCDQSIIDWWDKTVKEWYTVK